MKYCGGLNNASSLHTTDNHLNKFKGTLLNKKAIKSADGYGWMNFFIGVTTNCLFSYSYTGKRWDSEDT